ncbi:MAG TPA: DUF4019 domain-containing protein [Rhizomicrobium sp.]|jgi:hypothetical protein|nr:DUF4019 domain-containing protein [Rhizomicrobium sp.]
MFLRLILAILVLFGAATGALAQAAPAKASTVTAVTPTPDDRARQWLVLVDDKNYAQSWSEAGKAFQNRQKTDAWAAEAGAKRAPLGAVASRDLKSIDLSRNNTAVIRYDTAFAHKAAAVETVTLAYENGGWSVIDYSVN